MLTRIGRRDKSICSDYVNLFVVPTALIHRRSPSTGGDGINSRHVVADFIREREPPHCELEIILSKARPVCLPLTCFIGPVSVLRRKLQTTFTFGWHAFFLAVLTAYPKGLAGRP
jgi:hypothetical protein